MITLVQYFGPWMHCADATADRIDSAESLLDRVNALLSEAEAAGVKPRTNQKTGSRVSGTRYGGFRPQSCPEGRPLSAHKVGRGIDVFDPWEELENWITDEILAAHGLYREAPDSTPGWVHLTDRAPGSGRRTFQP